MTGRRVRLAVSLATACALTAPLVLAGLPGTAGADPLGDARSRAASLAATVQRLQTQAEVATERYDAAEAKLGIAVTERLLAQGQVDDTSAQSQQDRQLVDNRVRALYESGGATSLLATVLDGTNLTDALTRYHDVGVVLGFDQTRADDATVRANHAAATAARLAAAASRVTKLQTAAAAAAAQVQTLLSAERRALSAANRQVRTLVAQAEAAAAAASARSFQQALIDAGGSLNGTTTPPNDLAAAAIAAARTKLGDPYLWGGTGPNAYDCSGLTQFAYGQAGIVLPRVAADQFNVGAHVSLDALLPGDLLFWATDVTDPATIHHVAIYLGAGMMLAAPHTGDVVKIEPVYLDGYIGATRPWSNG